MSLGDAYTLGVRITGDLASLRQELAQANGLIASFSNTSVEAMNRAAGAINTAATALEQQAARTTKANESTKRSNDQTASSFQDYMRRATAAEQQVAQTSEATSQRTRSSMSSIGSVLGRLTGAAGFALLAKQVWDTGIGFQRFTQDTQVGLTVLLGSQQAAKSFLAEILAFAKQTPYAFTDLTNQAQRLLSYGIDAKNVVPVLTAIGDAATGMGKGVQGVDQLATAIGQIQAKGRLQSQELLQLSEIGVNGLKILANQAGVTTTEYSKLIEKGLIPADTAISGLINGIERGTNGVNGQTAAFDGLMGKIKGAGGITATLDSTRTSFRNAAAAVTDSLVPAYIDFLHIAQQGLGVVKDTANVFNGLPRPLQSSALAFVAATAAVRLLNVQGRATSVWSSFRENLATARVQADELTLSVGRTRAVLGTIRGSVAGVGSALMGAFGGPVGLAVTGLTVAISAYASAQAAAKQAIQEVGQTLDEQTAKVTQNTREWVTNKLSSDTSGWGPFKDNETTFDAAERLRINLDTVTDAALGSVDALEQVKAVTGDIGSGDPGTWTDAQNAEITAKAKALGLTTDQYVDAVQHLQKGVAGSNKTIDEAIRIAQQKAKADKDSASATYQVGDAYARASSKLVTFTEDQNKAIVAASDAASQAFTSALSLSSMKLDLSTAQDVSDARDKVKDATNGVRDAESNLAEVRVRKNHSANDVLKAEDALTEAKKRAKQATDDLADTQARRDPVAQYRKQQAQQLADAKRFRDAIKKLGEEGLNATDLQDLISKGPEGAKDQITALLKDKSLVGDTNANRKTLDAYATDIGTYAAAASTALLVPGQDSGKQFALGFELSLQQGTATTMQAIAAKLGQDPKKLYDVGMQWGMSWVQGLADADNYAVTLTAGSTSAAPGRGGYAPRFADGGIYPGYTPGRDIGFIGISGGEAIMRPEWTRAVGAGFVDRMNSAARSGGVAGVQAAMSRYLGGFAGGGIPAPQVVTVPVSVTNERNQPWTIQQAYFTDPRAAASWGRRAATQRNAFGG